MKVRNHLYSKKEYKGQFCEALDEYCPCRKCFNCHDCGYRLPNGEWVSLFECATRYNKGCPDLPPRPTHIFKMTKRFENRKKGDEFKCLRCGQKVKIGMGEFDFIVEGKNEQH